MRIGLFIPRFLGGTGGAEKVAAEVASLLSRHGHEAAIVTKARDRAPAYPLEERVEILPIKLRQGDELLSLRGRFDLLVGFAMDGFFARIAEIARQLEVPFAIQECTNPRRMVSTLYVRQQDGCRTLREAFWLRQAVFSQAAAVRFTMPAYATSVLPVIRPFAYAFYNSLSTPPEVDQTAKHRKIVCVGAMKNANKNGMAAVRAFAAFAEANPEWELHLYGNNAFARQLARLQRKKPALRIVDHGIETDISKIYGDAALLVIPSFEEGLPNVVVEAFSYGVPCIGFADCLGVSHLIADGETGLLVERDDPQELARALSRAADETVRRPMADKARAFALQHLGKADFEANWLRLVENATAGRDRDGQPRQPAGTARAEPFGRLLPTLLKRADAGMA